MHGRNPERGIGGLPPARSAPTLRLVLAGFGLVVSAVAAVMLALAGASSGIVAFFAVLAAIAVVDLAVIARRDRRGSAPRG
jgi:hypothetical protein